MDTGICHFPHKTGHNLNFLKPQIKHVLFPDGIEAIYLYGSAVKDRLRMDSDIDIAILASYYVDDHEILELMSKVEAIFTSLLKKIDVRQEVSIFDMRSKYASIELQYKIVTEGIVLYTRDISQRLEFENAVKRDYFDFVPYLTNLRNRKHGNIFQKI